METDKLIDAYILSHKKQFSRLSKDGVARVAYLAGYRAAQQTLAPDAVPAGDTAQQSISGTVPVKRVPLGRPEGE